MLSLPRGYYAVAADFENAPKDTFTYKGVTYAVEEGVNLFATALEADAAASETPEAVLEGLDYDHFEAPVLLFSKGVHSTKRLLLRGSRYLLGEGAGINPNLPVTDPLVGGERNSLRAAECETVFKDRHIEFTSRDADIHVIDGVSFTSAAVWDSRKKGNVPCYRTYFYNIIFEGPSNGHFFRLFSITEGETTREAIFRDCRLSGMDALGGCGSFMSVGAEHVTLDGIYYDNCEARFGFSDMRGDWRNNPIAARETEFLIRRSYFRDIKERTGIRFFTRELGDSSFSVRVEDSTFVNASLQGMPVFTPVLENKNSRFACKDCTFIDTRGGGVAVRSEGKGRNVSFENCSLEGFTTEWEIDTTGKIKAPAQIKNNRRAWTTATEDAHRVIGTDKADFTALDALYVGKKAYLADQHTHTACGGRSDGTFPMNRWVERMDEIGLDFAFIVDHRQMRGFFLPEWDTDRFVYGTEPGGKILDLKACRHNQCGFHYNMIFRDKYDLLMLLANFPEYKFQGDELTGTFGYPKFTRERFDELVAFIHSRGGMITHPHPADIMCSDDPSDYSFGEYTYFETLYGTLTSSMAEPNIRIWRRMLDAGLHVYAAGGSDTHGDPSVAVVSTFYCTERTADAAFDCMKSGDYTVGGFGFKMCIDGKPMGTRMAYRDKMKLTLRIDDYFRRNMKEGAAYELRILTDEGLAYASIFDGSEPQALSLEVQKRRFYRAEIYDLTNKYYVAIGNPIWLDG